MSDHTSDSRVEDQDPGQEPEEVRSLLDQLIVDSRMYTRGESFKALLDFVVKLPNFAPFNAMLLQVQKPGLSYAASTYEWRELFGRKPKENARPLLILWPFGPIALVYDVCDTEGEDLPEDVMSFLARDKSGGKNWTEFETRLKRKGIRLQWFDGGDRKAGYIRRIDLEGRGYEIHMNRNHDDAVRFVTLAHELGHLCLGHLGPDKKLKVPKRYVTGHPEQEIEAESVAYLVCRRNNVESRSEKYLSAFVDARKAVDRLNVHQIMRAAGRVEALLGLEGHSRFGPTLRAVGQKTLFKRRQAGDGP